MSEAFGKVCAAVSLSVALICAGTALADSPLAVGDPVAAATVVGHGFGQFRAVGLPPPPIVARPLAMFGGSGHWSSLFTSHSRFLPPVRRAGKHVLALSLLGVVGALALHRLNRTP